MTDSSISGTFSQLQVGQPRISVNQSGFNFPSDMVRQPVTMDDVDHLMAIREDFVDPLSLGTGGVLIFRIKLPMGVFENAVAFPLPDVESLSVPGIYQSVNVGTQFVMNRRGKGVVGGGHLAPP